MLQSERTMTIGDAEEVWRIVGQSTNGDVVSWHETLRNVQIRTSQIPALKTTSYFAALQHAKVIIDQTNHSFDMVTGSDRLPRILIDEFRGMLKRIAKNRGTARIIVLNGDADVFLSLRQEFSSALMSVETAKVTKPSDALSHFFSSDGARTRVEEPHEPLYTDSPDTVRAEISFSDKLTGDLLRKRFDAIQKGLRLR